MSDLPISLRLYRGGSALLAPFVGVFLRRRASRGK